MKKKIEQRLHELSYDSVREVTDGFELDSETKQRIYAKTIKKAGVNTMSDKTNTANQTTAANPVKKSGFSLRGVSFKKPAVAAAALVLACSLGVGSIAAAGALNKSFGQYFNTLSEENYRKMLFDINQTQSKNGVTVTLTQGMCDGSTLYVIEKVEYDPSLVTLTDEMFDTSDGTCKAPFWADETLVNTEYYSGRLERGFVKLLEHDEHSMTCLKTYDDNGTFGYENQFFRTGGKFKLTDSGIDNLPAQGNVPYECQFDFAFEIRLSDPVVYNLPEKTYEFDNELMFGWYEYYPDVWINPWYMRIASGNLTGKVLVSTNLDYSKPAVEITLNDGSVYSDGNGVLVGGNPLEGKDLFGKDDNGKGKYSDIFCTFDEEIDVTNIKSVKLYGYEMTVADRPKLRENDTPSVKQELAATNPVTFPQTETSVDVHEFYTNGDPNNPIEEFRKIGSMKYQIKGINVYDNLYAAGATYDDINKSRFENGYYLFYDKDVELYAKTFPQLCDTKTGALKENAWLVEYEIALTNVDIDKSVFEYEDLFDLDVYDKNNNHSQLDRVSVVYIKEHNSDDSSKITLPKGEERTLHIGFVVPDNNAGSLEQIGLSIDGSTPAFVNITKAVADLKKAK